MNRVAREILEEILKYDKHLPLDVVERKHVSEDERNDCDRFEELHVTFSSVHDQRVPALLTLPPDAEPPFPAVLILHGLFGHKSSFNQKKRAARLTSTGYATLRIDGQYCGERAVGGGIGAQTHYYYRNRDAMIQTAVDLMRGVDYLESRNDIDMARIGFGGFSMGGSIGTLFCAHEPRVKGVVLGITGGDFREFRARSGDEQTNERIREAYRIVDPIHCVAGIAPRPLLMLNAARDEVIPKAATEALFEAAREPKEIVWYDCGHAGLPDDALATMEKFFNAALGARS